MSNATVFRKFTDTLRKMGLFFVEDVSGEDFDFEFVDKYWSEDESH